MSNVISDGTTRLLLQIDAKIAELQAARRVVLQLAAESDGGQGTEGMVPSGTTAVVPGGTTSVTNDDPPTAAVEDEDRCSPRLAKATAVKQPRPATRQVKQAGGKRIRQPTSVSRIKILKHLKEHGPKTGRELSNELGLSPTYIYELMDHEWYEKESDGYHLTAAGQIEHERQQDGSPALTAPEGDDD